VARVLPYELDYVLHPRAGREDFGNAALFQPWDVFVRYDAAAEDDHVIESLLAREFYDAREQRHMRARQNRQADRIDVFLNSGGYNLLGRLAQASVDDFHPGIAKRSRDDFYPAVVPVQTGLCKQYPYSFFRHEHLSFSICHFPFVIFSGTGLQLNRGK
jgi:hypothetical protein